MNEIPSYFVHVISFIVSVQGVPFEYEVLRKAVFVKLVLVEVYAVCQQNDVLLKHPVFNDLLALAGHRTPRWVTKFEHYHQVISFLGVIVAHDVQVFGIFGTDHLRSVDFGVESCLFSKFIKVTGLGFFSLQKFCLVAHLSFNVSKLNARLVCQTE